MTLSFFQKNVDEIKKIFSASENSQDKYHFLIEMGKKLDSLPVEFKIEQNKVSGCQSTLYLYSYLKNSKLHFLADADALISKGLAALLITAYQGLTPSEILKSEPTFIEEIGLLSSLSFNRSNGLMHIHQKMKKDALNFLIQELSSLQKSSN